MTENRQLGRGEFHGTPVAAVEGREFGFYEYRYDPKHTIAEHAHRQAFVSIVVTGSYVERLSASKRIESSTKAVYHPPGEEHSQEFGIQGAQLFGFSIAENLLEWVHDCGFKTRDRCSQLSPVTQVRTWRIYSELAKRTTLSLFCAEALAMEVLSDLPAASTHRRGSQPPRWLLRAIEMLNVDRSFTLRLSTIAREVGVSPTHLAREFRRIQGCSVGSYVKNLRLQWTIAQLGQGDKALVEIATLGGFSDQSHLTRVIRSATGMTPKELMRRKQLFFPSKKF